MSNFKKLAEQRIKRAAELDLTEETPYDNYTPVCPDHAGIRRELLDTAAKKKLGLSLTEMAWKCPVDDKVYETEPTLGQPSVAARMNHDPQAGASIADEDGKYPEIDTIKSDSERKIRE
jgi:hypothetical protein